MFHDSFYVLLYIEMQLLLFGIFVDMDDRPLRQVAIDDELSKTVLDMVLDGTLERTGTKLHVVALLGQELLGLVAELYLIAHITDTLEQTFEFDIAEQGNYVIAVYSAAAEWSDCIVGQLSLTASSYLTTGISQPSPSTLHPSTTYDLQGRRVNTPTKPGIYIRNGKKVLFSK